MLQLRHGEERGHTQIDWLDSYHTFSFGDYYDPKMSGFGDLRVINDDRVQPQSGFGMHSHHDMEILTYVIEGTLAHKDSMGNAAFIYPCDVQRMTAGTGVRHSEYNPSHSHQVHLLQIWVLPERRGLSPGYEQKSFSLDNRHNHLQLVASRDGRQDSLTIHQDMNLYILKINPGAEVDFEIPPNRMAWIQVATGEIRLNGTPLKAGDGVGIPQAEDLLFQGVKDNTQILLFDLRRIDI